MRALETCDERLQRLAQVALERSHIDFMITEGHRGIERQQRLFAEGKTHIDGITKLGMHNYLPSKAWDFVPVPVDWQDTNRFYLVAGGIISTANVMGIAIVWGGDWNMNGRFDDQKFHDLPHIQLAHSEG
jgi:peptidoglycan LD-endopeptidase CwlK